MNALLRFLKRYQRTLYFLLLEAVALGIFFGYSPHQKAQLGFSIKRLEAHVEAKIGDFLHYFSLASANERLVHENLQLRNELAGIHVRALCDTTWILDSLHQPTIRYIPATVASNSVSQQRNFFSLEAGELQGVKPQMPVIAHGAAAGIIVATSKNYSEAISLLNTDLQISALLKRTGYYGSVRWDGINHRSTLLYDIPHHVEVLEGDTVVTSGYSNIFPPGILIGTVQRVEQRNGDFTTLRIALETDFKRLRYVSLIERTMKTERDSLQTAINDDAE